MSRSKLQRRTFLKGLGTTMALPLLEGMRSESAFAAPSSATAPTRMALIFFPNGAIMPQWKPTGESGPLELSPTLKPLERHKQDMLVFSGLTQHHARANGDGPGDHARNASAFLTGSQPFKTSGANIRVGVSVDQAAAAVVGKQTRFSSLELGIVRGRNAGGCDSGYSCAYSSNISWKSASTPMAKEINPKLVFERLFGSPDDKQAARGRTRRNLYRKSVLDLVSADASRLRDKLGKTDRQKVEEYFSSVRELELRIEQAATKSVKPPKDFVAPSGTPRDYKQHVRLMYDLMALSFQTDSTRITTFMLGNAGSNRNYQQIGVSGGHHSMSHHRNDEKKMADIQKIDQYQVEQLGYFLDKLKAIKEAEGTLLDHSMVLFGSAIADGNKHSHHDLPIVLAGGGGGTLKMGRHLKFEENTPLNNLFLGMCHRVGATSLKTLGDSTGVLKGIEA
jgi:hypothetical protein